ncbi:MAG: hypothetical protein LQ351_004572 [Letrouitia transgressa]|nr:MAG: hypothetical protein LQ351_004572 [Letrouitia transgressa]
MTYQAVHFNVSFPQQFVAHVEINRPSKMNCFLAAMWLELRAIFDQMSYDPDIRSIIFSGSGNRAFTAGLDVREAGSEGILNNREGLDPGRRAKTIRKDVREIQDCVSSIERCEKPVICILNGISFGLAIDLACCCDLRICSSDVRFSVKEVDIGVAADLGTLNRLPRIVGSFAWVKEVCISARVFQADEALQMGFVNAVGKTKDDAIAKGLTMAKAFACKSPIAVQGTKELLNHSRDHSVQDSLRYTGVWNTAAAQSQDVTQALLSGIQRRNPRFEKL